MRSSKYEVHIRRLKTLEVTFGILFWVMILVLFIVAMIKVIRV